jgi:ricin-type beta-trefoil lectin protein
MAGDDRTAVDVPHRARTARRARGGGRRWTLLLAAAVGLVASIASTGAAHASVGSHVEIINDVSGKCVDVKDKSQAPGALVQQFQCHNVNEQLWLPIDTGNGYFMLQSRNTPSQCLDVQFGSTLPETPVDQQSCSIGGARMQWRFLGGDDEGHLVLNSALGNLCLALSGVFSARNGWPIVIHDCATTGGQFWHFG